MLIYAGIAGFGVLLLLGMLVFGEIFGGDHGDAAHADHDGGGPSVLSARVIAAFLAARYYDLGHPAASGLGTVCGLVMATLVYQFAKVLYGQQSSSDLKMSGLVGTPAHVSVAIPEHGVGQVIATSGGQQTEHIARSDDGRAVARGTEVVVTGMRGDAVIVAPAGPRPGGGA
jgi:membrane protein implicated in regulation of membrane protease activity